MSANGQMVYIAYLKKALRIATKQRAFDVFDNPRPTEIAVQKQVDEWVKQARAECKLKSAQREQDESYTKMQADIASEPQPRLL